jgi:hypothetical protein
VRALRVCGRHPGCRACGADALARFERDIAAVPKRAAKVAQVKAAALACSLNASCTQGGVPSSAAANDDD